MDKKEKKWILLKKILGTMMCAIGAFFFMGGMLVTFAGLTSEKGINIFTCVSTMGIMYILGVAFTIIGIKLLGKKYWKLILGIGFIVIGVIWSVNLIVIRFAKISVTDKSMILSFIMISSISFLSGIILIKKHKIIKSK